MPNCGGCSSEEKQLANKLCLLISSKKGCLQLEMPVAWFMLNVFIALIHKKFFQFEDFKKFCLQCDCIEKEQQDEQYEALLSLFHSLGLFFTVLTYHLRRTDLHRCNYSLQGTC